MTFHGKLCAKPFESEDCQTTMLCLTLGLLKSYKLRTMTSSQKPQYFGPPPPVLELTIEQQFKLRQIEDALSHPDTAKEDIIIVFIALQRQCFTLSNCVSNLVAKWPTPTTQDQPTIVEDLFKFGTSSETKD